MKLSLCALLVALALCCYQAEAAMTCPALADEMTSFVMSSETGLRAYLAQFKAPPEAVEAKMLVKKCVNDNITLKQRLQIVDTLSN
ncbi:secretoglobin family 1D member 2-like [Sorex fumeus]|uniref:secretoglobin family 1D member 2-like n=1 Tax=Sorex fumeus TaxID=62283 RepID=UPI0024AC8D6A|nr:secretoglobin family 1D member 2-like [Sorex fumeus]